jgi:hypothetical protein
MAVTAASFKALYPEFGDAPDALIEGKLAEAVLMCPDRMWGDLADQGVGLYTAQYLYESPYARHMARVDQGNDRQGVRSDASPYNDRLRRLVQQVASGSRVL